MSQFVGQSLRILQGGCHIARWRWPEQVIHVPGAPSFDTGLVRGHLVRSTLLGSNRGRTGTDRKPRPSDATAGEGTLDAPAAEFLSPLRGLATSEAILRESIGRGGRASGCCIRTGHPRIPLRPTDGRKPLRGCGDRHQAPAESGPSGETATAAVEDTSTQHPHFS